MSTPAPHAPAPWQHVVSIPGATLKAGRVTLTDAKGVAHTLQEHEGQRWYCETHGVWA